MDKADNLTKETSVCGELYKESPLWHLTERIYGIHTIRVFNDMQKAKKKMCQQLMQTIAYPLIKYK